MTYRSAFILVVALVSCSPKAEVSGPPPEAAPQATSNPRSSDAARLVSAPGRVYCHDKARDLWSEGSGDQTGPPRRRPDPAQPVADLAGVSMDRYRTGMTINFGGRARIPAKVPSGASLRYSFTVSPVRGAEGVGAVSVILLHDDWIVEARDGDRYNVLDERPELVGEVLTITLETDQLPELMRGPFRWGARAEWTPAPSEPLGPGEEADTFFDYCPNTGFPVFWGRST